MLSLVLGLLRAGETGRGNVTVIGPLLLAAVLAAAFLAVEARTADASVRASWIMTPSAPAWARATRRSPGYSAWPVHQAGRAR